MKRFALATVAGFILATSVASAGALKTPGRTPFWTTPAIPGYGAIHLWPHESALLPRTRQYHAIFYIPQAIVNKTQADPELGRVARMLNIFKAERVPFRNLHFVVVFDGGAIPAALSNAAYEKRFGRPNPNGPLVSALLRGGVHFYVCGVALAGWKFTPASLWPHIGVAPSGPSTLILYENQGYALIPF
jgi:intracellular sulfur oxidation DsrE/DsrF family protein